MGTYYRWEQYSYGWQIVERDRGNEIGLSSVQNYIYTSNNFTNGVLVQTGGHAGYFKFSFGTVDSQYTGNAISAQTIILDYEQDDAIYAKSFYYGNISSITLSYSNFDGWKITCPYSTGSVMYRTTSHGKGNYIGYVYSTSSSAYPNGGASGNYWYDNRTTISSPSTPSSISYPNPSRAPSVTVSWGSSSSSVPGYSVSNYTLQRSVDGGGWTTVATTSSRSYTASIPSSAKTVQFRVRANDSGGQSSSYRSGSTYNTSNTPSAPSEITVPYPLSSGSTAQITWGESTITTDTIASYILERSIDQGSWTQIYSGSDLSYTDTIGDWGTVQYRVQAVNDKGLDGPYTTSDLTTIADGVIYIEGPELDLGEQDSPFNFTFELEITGETTAVADVDLYVFLDEDEIYHQTVSTQEQITIPIDVKVVGEGNHSIRVLAQKADYVGANIVYTFNVPTIEFPSIGNGVVLSNENGIAIFPVTVANVIQGVNGLSVGGNLLQLYDALGENTARVYANTYTGTGSYGQSNQNTLIFPFEPEVIYILSQSSPSHVSDGYGTYPAMVKGITRCITYFPDGSSSGYYCTVIWNGNQVSWYSSNNAAYQLNTSGETYYYVGIG